MNKLNTELLKANSELKTLNLTKDKFFSIISHDLKGPISSQNQILNLLHENPNEFQEDEKNEYLNLLYESSKNTYNLLENLLVWGKVQMNGIQVHYSSFDLNEVILRIFENLELSATIKKIELINECPSNYLMNGDIGMISTVIRNITNNSIKFTLSKGRIILNAYNDGDYHHITINDNGIGMTEKSLNNLFRIDVQNSTLGTNNEKGTGLGLIISKEFIEIHNGKLWLESKPGNGTTCHILIPIAIIPEHQKIEYSNPIYLSE
jgi:signal transduction histidine kinase